MTIKPLFYPSDLFVVVVLAWMASAGCTGDAARHAKEGAGGADATQGADTVARRVLDHYRHNPSDSLQYKAAQYLLSNMDGLSWYEGPLLDKYQDYCKLIRRDPDHGEYFMYSFNMLYGPFRVEELTKRYDRVAVRSDELIGNIDAAFSSWREQPWGRDIDFHTFCEYLLPFRIDNEIPEYQRKAIHDEFDPLLDSIRKIRGDAAAAGAVLNDALGRYPWIFSLRASFLPHFRASQILQYRVGSCREMTDLAFYVMRATGIPVSIDFIPQWPYRSMGHEFNALIDKEGKPVMFLGSEDSPGTPHKPGVKMAKVYRHTYAKNPLSLAMIKNDSDKVPRMFDNPRLRDVTDQYVRTVNLRVTLSAGRADGEGGVGEEKFAYLGVFNNESWIPVTWGQVQGGQVSFPNVEGDIVYIACYYRGSRVVPVGDPLIAGADGVIRYLRPDSGHLNKQMLLTGIFPVLPDDFDNWHMSGCRFQGADRPDFGAAQDLYVIPRKPNPFWNEIGLKEARPYRFVRYVGKGYTHMGEMELYDGDRKLRGKAMGSKTGWYANKTFDKAVDGDVATSFDPAGANTDTCWVGLDLGRKERVSRIRFSAPLHEDLHTRIVRGHLYELSYWDEGKWRSVGTHRAETEAISFGNIPGHALYILRDKTQQMESRIFTYEGGKQLWW